MSGISVLQICRYPYRHGAILAFVCCMIEVLSCNSAHAEMILLRNSELTAKMDPKIRRLVHLGKTGGPNILWMNDMLPATLPPTGYINFGGEKAWLWPQSRWPSDGAVLNWPPRDDMVESPPFTILSQSDREVCVISAPSKMASVRIQRRYELTSTAMIIDTRLVVDSEKTAEGWASWSILQLPVPIKVVTNAPPKTEPVAGSLLAAKTGVNSLPGGRWELTPPDVGDTKIGVDASLLIAVYADYQIAFSSIVRNGEASAYRPGERAQIYIRQPKDRRPTVYGRDYLELEFTGPPLSATSKDSWLQVRIELQSRP